MFAGQSSWAAAPVVQKAPAANLTAAYNAYLNRLRDKVLTNWNVPDGKNRVTLQVRVETDGTNGEVAVTSSPSNTVAEQAATAAWSLAQPLEPLPAQSPAVRIILTFESSADPHGDSTSNLFTRLEPLPAAKPDTSDAPAQ
jgi:hypothetical protein